MLIVENKVRIQHVPRTGGTWLRTALTRAGVYYQSHTPVHEAIGPLSWYPTAYVIRDKEDWYQSYWRFKSREGWDNSNSFDDFVRDCPDYPTFRARCGDTWEQMIREYAMHSTHALRFEYLYADLLSFFHTYGIFLKNKELQTLVTA